MKFKGTLIVVKDCKRAIKLLIGVVLLALYELLLDGSGVGMRERWNKLKGWSGK